MKSVVIIRMIGDLKYEITLDTEDAAALVASITRKWAGKPGVLPELNLVEGSRVRINPAHAVAVEVR